MRRRNHINKYSPIYKDEVVRPVKVDKTASKDVKKLVSALMTTKAMAAMAAMAGANYDIDLIDEERIDTNGEE